MTKTTTDASKVELKDEQLNDVQGGAWYAKFEGVDGSSEARSSTGGAGGAGKVKFDRLST